MIVASLLLIPVAVLFLALGLVNGSSSLLITSIVVSLLAAVALVIGTRQAAARRLKAPFRPGRRDPESDEPVAFAEDSPATHAAPAGESRRWEAPSEDEVAEARAAGSRDTATRSGDRPEPSGPSGADYADSDSAADSGPSPLRSDEDEQAWRPAAPVAADPAEQADEFAEPDDDDPDDEPLPQSVRPADAVLVARFDTEVLVVDGRPRYHMADCPHLVGRLTEPLPVNEAVELGFSPCGLCRPVDRLVAAVAQQR
ncbi:hypothetical protein [Actinoplanes derwentensis]|uniref:Clumping factor A n=1 Tax=Actinoplanes derwentensis TaxID=113562 RepID=A0A1H2BZC1_9ACTN|nr:hypothetical protein [Actinoplanes derwentensis]GID84612.1 hypothetical protein Ade03nite_35360 [Actinoplanes derwentensis]SDT63503.1 clumping factor A [Actinoplanes derwentensis]